MFEQAFDTLRQATDSTLQLQQDMFRKWSSQWPGAPAVPPVWTEKFQKFQKNWQEVVAELLKKNHETLEAHFKSGLKNIEEAAQLGKIKDPEEFRAKLIELWHKSFDYLSQVSQTQLRNSQAFLEKCFEAAANKKNET